MMFGEMDRWIVVRMLTQMAKGIFTSVPTSAGQSDKRCLLRWSTVATITILAWGAMFWLFWPTVRTLIASWMVSRTFTHGFLVLPATVYLLWFYRQHLTGIVPTPNLSGLAVFSLLVCGWFISHQAGSSLWEQVSLVGMLPALVWVIAGTCALRVLSFPLGLLTFALPIGTAIEVWLQDFTTTFLEVTLNAVGVPLLREGYFLHIPSGRWEVATDCAGLRYVLPGLALGYMYAAMMYRQALRRVAFLILCGLFLILANGVRAFGIIFFDFVGLAEGTDHRVFSYLVYGITIVFLAWVGTTWGDDTTEDATHGESPQVDSA